MFAEQEIKARTWVLATMLDQIPGAGGKQFRYLDKRLSVFRTPTGVYATDNRCPHQGYALARGTVGEDVLTCEWHNWKFDLATGACLFGGEDVRTYPVDIRGSEVWVDVTDPPAEQIVPQLFESLIEAFDEVDLGRMARDTMRLQRYGTSLVEIVREGARFGAPRARYGWNHSLATLTDCLYLAASLDGPVSSLPVVQGLSCVAETQVRRPFRPRPEPVDPVATYGSIDEALRAFRPLVEADEEAQAEALLRGLIAAGVEPAILRRLLLAAITDHFLDYGHPMIYAMKAFELLSQIGWAEADEILGPLVPSIVTGTKYDRLPYMIRFRRVWEAAELDLAALLRRSPRGAFDASRFERALLDGSPEDAFAVLREALEAGTPVTQILDATIRAASQRFARFDIDLDFDETNEWGWLDVTHTMTYLDALRWAWSVSPGPDVLRGVFHAVWFVQWTQQLDARGAPPPVEHARGASTEDLLAAIRRHDPEAAQAIVHGIDVSPEDLERAVAQMATEDQHTAPIMIAHSVKTARASILETRALGGDRTPIAATARFLASPKRERRAFRATLEAVAFVQGRGRGDGT